MRPALARSVALATWLVSAGAIAQETAPSSSATAPSTEAVAPPPTPPQVSDPMLAPPPDVPRSIGSWRDALELVRERSPEYRTNLETIRRAEAQTRIALAALLPTVTGQASYAHNFFQLSVPFDGQTLTTPPPDVGALSATVSWTPLSAKAYFDRETAKQNVEVTRTAFADKRRLIATSLVGAILATLSSARVAELNRVGLKSALERLHLTEARLQYGQGTPLDVDRAREDVAASRRLIISGDESLRRARESLGVALGSPEPISVSTSLDLETFERAVASTCRLNDSIEHRPDVAAARARVELAKRAVTSAELSTAPTVGLVSQGAYTSAPVLAPNGSLSVQGVLTVPFYDGGLRYGQLRDARAAEAQAAAQLDATRLNAVVTAARAQRSVDVSRADHEVSKEQRDLAERVDMRTREAYSRGRGTSLDLVTSAQALRLAEINLAIVEFQLAEARADAVLENAECTY